MLEFNHFYSYIANTELAGWLETLPAQLKQLSLKVQHDDLFIRLDNNQRHMPQLQAEHILLGDVVSAYNKQITTGQQQQLTYILKQLMPWRKGPYNLYGIHIYTEWRSDLKWQRLLPHIKPLANKNVLDVGCGNGYHMWRMLEQGANSVIGLDPTILFLYQFNLIKQLLNYTHDPVLKQKINLIPLGLEEVPALATFDTVFSMGVLYHRISPLQHLLELKQQLKAGGQLVLESLVIDDKLNCNGATSILTPTARYAKMRNVYFIPSVTTLQTWLTKTGFIEIKCIDITTTSLDEQHKTDWIAGESLADFLDPNDSSKTIEGYPAPTRAIFLATKP